MSLRVCLIVGDNDTQYCGVKDYAFRLAEALETIGLSAEVLAPADWGVKSFFRFCEKLRERKFDIVDVQYPSIGNRRSLGPHLLGHMRVAKGVVATLHEHSALPRIQRVSTQLFRWSAGCLLFTDEGEMLRYGSSGAIQRVIHLGSNVPAYPTELPRTPTVLYFGQIRPNKGLDEFLELARQSVQLRKPFKYQVIGSVSQRREAYYWTMRKSSVSEVDWLLNLTFEEVAKHLAGSLATYLAYPDGASYRRGSLLAALTNGLPAITTIDQATPRDLRAVLLRATSPEEALAHVERLYANPCEARALSCAVRSFSERFSWPEIAHRHEQAYIQTLSRVGRRPKSIEIDVDSRHSAHLALAELRDQDADWVREPRQADQP